MSMIGSLEATTVRVSPVKRRGRRSNDLICYMNVTGLVAVLYVLLIGCMVQGPVCSFSYARTPVDLPKVQHPDLMRAAEREDALNVAVRRDGYVFFRADRVDAEHLPTQIREAVAHGAENRVYIRADARAKFASVKEVLDAVRASGVEDVAFITEQRHPSSAQ